MDTCPWYWEVYVKKIGPTAKQRAWTADEEEKLWCVTSNYPARVAGPRGMGSAMEVLRERRVDETCDRKLIFCCLNSLATKRTEIHMYI